MKQKMIKKLLITSSLSLLAISGLVLTNTSHQSNFTAVNAESEIVTSAVEISNGTDFVSAINNAYDGLFVKLMNDITYGEKITVPSDCFVTIEMNGHTVFFESNMGNNIGVKLSSTLMLQNGTWSGTFDTDDSDSGTIILNAFKQILPEGENDLTEDGKDCNAKGVIFAGHTKMWIVNGCDIHRITTEHGAINPGASALNPWESDHMNSEIAEENVAKKQPYDFENPAPAMVGSGSTWEIKATLAEDFERSQTGGDDYKHIILLKNSTITADATLEAANKIFDLSGHELTLAGYKLNITNNSGLNIIRNGSINGDVDFSVGTGDVELTRLSMSGQIINNQHDITISNGYYGNVVTDTGMIHLKDGYYYGTYSGDRYEMISGYYVSQPGVNQIALGSESAECSVVEKSITYNYKIIDTQPTKENDYTAALNDSISGASFQWYKRDIVSTTPDESYIEYVETGTIVSPGVVSSGYNSEMDMLCVILDFTPGKVNEGDIITFKCDVEATTLLADVGEVTSLGDSKYSCTVKTYYGGQFFAVIVSEETTVYDISIATPSDVAIDGETNARLSNSTLNNTEYFCKVYKNGNLTKTTNKIEPNAVSFVCGTEGATGDNPETIYQLEGRTITLPSNPYAKACYAFDGWYEDDVKIDAETYTVGGSNAVLSARLTFGDHTYSDEWSYNDTHHWHAATCEHVDEKSSYDEHDWNDGVITTQPTETSKGIKTYTCQTCGKTKTEDVAKLTHEKGQHHDATAAGCLTEGNVEYWDCKNCDAKLDAEGNLLETVVTPATGHTYSTEWSHNENLHWHAATCEHTDEKADVEEHSWNSGEITTQPTETSKGVKTYTCTVCNHKKTEDIPQLNHEKGEHHNANAATCTTDGNVEYWDCLNCGGKLDAEGNLLETVITPATGHAYSSEWSHNETSHWHAATCGHDEKSALAEHTWDDGVVTMQPTETTYGIKTYTCTVCGGTKIGETPMLTHEKGGHHNANAATCTTNGNVEYWDCLNCGGKLDADGNILDTIVVPATGHSYSTEWSHDETSHWHAATCEHTEEKADVANHTWNEGVITTQPTETTKGVKTYTCTVCGATKIEEVPVLTHEKGDHHDAVSATCTTDGNVEYWDCVNCDKKLDADGNVIENIVVAAEGHNIVKVEAEEPKVGVAGHKEYYECTKCHEHFEDENGVNVIEDLNLWIHEGGNGYLAPLEPSKKQSLCWLWIILLILLLLLFYIAGYFFLYRKGRLDDKAIRVIYKWLPRGDKNKQQDK